MSAANMQECMSAAQKSMETANAATTWGDKWFSMWSASLQVAQGIGIAIEDVATAIHNAGIRRGGL